MRNLVVFSGSSHPDFSEKICRRLGIRPGKSSLEKFSNNETKVELYESVREQDVYIVQSGCGHVNDNFIELLIMIQACKTASAKKVTAGKPSVPSHPLLPYSRQPDVPYKRAGAPLTRAPPMTVPSSPHTIPSTPKTHPSTPLMTDTLDNPFTTTALSKLSNEMERIAVGQQFQRTSAASSLSQCHGAMSPGGSTDGYRQWVAKSGTLIAELLECAGADHIITMDLHDPQFQGFFDCPVDNLSSLPMMIKCIEYTIPNFQEAVIVSPDAGGAKRATSIAEKMCMDFALIHKERRSPDKPLKPDLMLVGDVKDKVCILIDDIADTSFTITKAAKLLHETGATKIYAVITHAILSGDAVERIQSSHLDAVIVSDSVPQTEHTKKCSKIQTFSVAAIFSEAVRRTHSGESLSTLFESTYDFV
ncbi:phosphoribosyltransferase-like protein [Spinellus fusiger]|nr:phosphoribosyltransferase-like protein [Spinellus fusiger]